MKIERIEDKKFQITLTEKEALRISDCSQMDWEYAKIYALHLGRIIINFMALCSEIPHAKQPPLETEL